MLTYPCKLNLDFVENPLKLMPILSEAASWLWSELLPYCWTPKICRSTKNPISHCQDSVWWLHMWVPPLQHLAPCNTSVRMWRECCYHCFQVGNGDKHRLSNVPKVTKVIGDRGGTDKSLNSPCINAAPVGHIDSHHLSCMWSTKMS